MQLHQPVARPFELPSRVERLLRAPTKKIHVDRSRVHSRASITTIARYLADIRSRIIQCHISQQTLTIHNDDLTILRLWHRTASVSTPARRPGAWWECATAR